MTTKDNNNDQIQLNGRFNQYTSGYWALALAALASRYITRPFTKSMGNAYAAVVGATMYGATAFYAKRTYDDMSKVFAGAVGYEFNKKPEDVTYSDFMNSKNEVVRQTFNNFFKYNTRRFAVNTAFFSFLLPKVPGFKKFNIKSEDAVDLGVGANGLYLASDVVSRKITFFEDLQALIDRKINQSDRIGERVTADDLLNLYERHAKSHEPEYSLAGKTDTPVWNKSLQVFSRMADLMNQTYNNTVAHEQADFNIPKFLYMLGNGLLHPQDTEQALAYIEVANKAGIEALKQVVESVNSGVDVKTAAAPFLGMKDVLEKAAPTVGFDKVEQEKAIGKFTEKLGETRSDMQSLAYVGIN